MRPAVLIKDLTFSYGKGKNRVEVLHKLNLEVLKGEVFGFIGPNGAGKTTTIKHILGIIPSKKKKIELFGLSPSDSLSRISLGYMPEVADYYGFLTPIELLMMYGNICLVDSDTLIKRVHTLIEMVGLSGHERKRLSAFSKGMMQKVSFAQALVNDPEILVLDEPTGGLDPVARKNMRHVISGLKAQGKTVFFSSHELSEVELVADKIGVINRGQLVVTGSVRDLMGDKGTEQTLENYFLQLIGAQK